MTRAPARRQCWCSARRRWLTRAARRASFRCSWSGWATMTGSKMRSRVHRRHRHQCDDCQGHCRSGCGLSSGLPKPTSRLCAGTSSAILTTRQPTRSKPQPISTRAMATSKSARSPFRRKPTGLRASGIPWRTVPAGGQDRTQRPLPGRDALLHLLGHPGRRTGPQKSWAATC